MTDIFTDLSVDFFGDESQPVVATGSIITTLSGELGAGRRDPVLVVYSRTGSASFVNTHQQVGLGRQIIEMAPGDEYYVNVTSVGSDASLDLSVVAIE